MSNTITALLDLDKAIAVFRDTIESAMALDEISQWDGNQLREREQQIRQAALVLAGQCIALLLTQLSQLPTAQKEASKRTEGLRRPESQGGGKQTVRILTMGNVEVTLRLPYVLGAPAKTRKRKRKVGQRGRASLGGFYPFLSWLGLPERVTPLVWSTVAQQGMLSTSFAAARDNLKDWGIKLSDGRIQRLTYCFGGQGKALRQRQLDQLQGKKLRSGKTLKGKQVVISVDGGRTRLRRRKRGKVRTSGRHGYHGKWREPKLLTIYAVDEQGRQLNTLEIPITNDGTFAKVETFMDLLEMHLVRLGIVEAQQVLLLADGADWIWQRLPQLLKKLQVPSERVFEVIDFYHAAEHLQTFAEAACTSKKKAKTWYKQSRSKLKQGQIESLLTQMQTMATQAKTKRKRSQSQKALNYFCKQPQRFDYQRVQRMNLPIGSGAIESLIRQVVNLRLKSTGKFWLEEHAEVILLGRCQWAAGAWEQFCSDIFTANLTPISANKLIHFQRDEFAAA